MKILKTVGLSLICCVSVFAQKKPTLMILPSDNWCIEHNYILQYDNQGERVRVSNYQQAFQEDRELNSVIGKMGELMLGYGYYLKDAHTELKNVLTRTAEDNVTYSKTSGAQLAESPIDVLKRKAKADIIIQVGWFTARVTGGRALQFTVEAFDAYTSKRIATVQGKYDASALTVADALQQGVKKQLKQFDKQLDGFFSKMKSSGRESLLTIRVWDNWDNDLETEFVGEELLVHIQHWLSKNTVNGQFSLSEATENQAKFEQVMIPIKDDNNTDVDARSFAQQLQHYLKRELDVTSKLMMCGLGEAILVLGEK